MLSKFVSTLLSRPASRSHRNYKLCSECRTWFYLTPIEVSFYASQEAPVPGTCRSCKANADHLAGGALSQQADGLQVANF